MRFSRSTVLGLILAAGFAVIAADAAEARGGGGRSFGSRGGKTFMAPPATNTAPKAAPVEKSMTQKAAPAAAQNAQPTAAAQASRFGGVRGLLMGGLIAAALAGIFGWGALASVLGFVLQFALIAGAAYLIMAFIRARSQPALSRASAQGPELATRDRGLAGHSLGGLGGASAAAVPLAIGQQDLDTFEKLLGEVQTAYGREDTKRLGDITTPEMLSYLAHDLAANARQGLRNDISDVKLLQGDVSEAWRENGSDYATVAVRYSLLDTMVDRGSGEVVSGDPARPTEATEFWTFRRDDRSRDGWQLSAIQQAA